LIDELIEESPSQVADTVWLIRHLAAAASHQWLPPQARRALERRAWPWMMATCSSVVSRHCCLGP
jgi:hypothetical protein